MVKFMEFQRVSKKAKWMWRVTRIIFMLIVILPLCLVPLFFDAMPIFYFVSIPVLLLYIICALIIYPYLEYIQWAYLITNDRIEIKKGIFFRTHNIIPIGRIQHVNVYQGPIARMFGLSRVEIHTAGCVFHIEGVDNETANEIGEKLRNLVGIKLDSKKA